MRVVIYSNEDMEPITVVDIPIDTRNVYRHYRLPIYPQYEVMLTPKEPEPIRQQYVEIWFERFVRGNQTSWMAFTNADALAMLLDPAWLPGQLPAIRRIEQDRDMLTDLLVRMMVR